MEYGALYLIGLGIMIVTFRYWISAGMKLGFEIIVGGPIILLPLTYFIVKHMANK